MTYRLHIYQYLWFSDTVYTFLETLDQYESRRQVEPREEEEEEEEDAGNGSVRGQLELQPMLLT